MKQLLRNFKESTLPVLSLSVALLILPMGVTAETSAKEVVEKANLAALYGGADGRAEARMKITDSQGRSQYRQFTMLRRDIQDGGDQQFYVIFSRPSEVDRTVFLVEKHVEQDDDRWLYLPGLDLVKRIAAGDKRTSFVGSHFFYEDISGRNVAADEYRLIDESGEFFHIEAIPRQPDTVEFSRYEIWVDKQTYLPQKAEYYDRNNTPYRRAETLKTEVIDDIATGTVLRMTDLRDGGHTLTEMRFVNYDIGIPESVFSERSLRNPPREWLSRKK